MKISFLSVLILACPMMIFGQQITQSYGVSPNTGPHRPLSAAEFTSMTIEHLLDAPSPLTVGNAQLHRLGDQTATEILKAKGTNRIAASQIPIILDMLYKSFERPDAIVLAINRQPITTLSLLTTLAALTTDAGLLERIAGVRLFAIESLFSSVGNEFTGRN